MKTTNTTGAISTAVKNTAVEQKKASPANIMRGILDAEATRKLLADSLKENAGAYAASILDLYNTDKYLQACDARQVFSECLKAVSLKLPISKQLGFAYVIAYKGVPSFQIGYKGLIQLAMRSGSYRYINADRVYEGEFKGRNKLTGELDISGEATSDKVVGYFAYLETINGFSHSLYMTKDEVIKHAKRYSKTYGMSNSAWATNFDEMSIKTVLRNLLSHYGYMSVEMTQAMQAEEAPADTATIDQDDVVVVDAETGEVKEEAPVVTEEAKSEDIPAPEEPYPFA